MAVIISSEKIIREIQEDFNRVFPFLKIEFFLSSNNRSGTIKKISNLLTIGTALSTKETIEIELYPYMTVKDFESDFATKFGMYVQLYRKSGNLWQEITLTDIWTVKQQDQTGNEISSLIRNEPNSRPWERRPLIQKAV